MTIIKKYFYHIPFDIVTTLHFNKKIGGKNNASSHPNTISYNSDTDGAFFNTNYVMIYA